MADNTRTGNGQQDVPKRDDDKTEDENIDDEVAKRNRAKEDANR